jgi:hypothetical protein
MDAPENIANFSKVVEALGYWPSFHDAEVISFKIERALPYQAGKAVAKLAVNVRQYESTGEGTVSYEQALKRNVLIHFKFECPRELELNDFNDQNVIDSINVTRCSDLEALQVSIDSIWGFGGTFLCTSAAVEAVDVLSTATT